MKKNVMRIAALLLLLSLLLSLTACGSGSNSFTMPRQCDMACYVRIILQEES